MLAQPPLERPLMLVPFVLVALLWLSAVVAFVWWVRRDAEVGTLELLGWVLTTLLVPFGLPYHCYRWYRGRSPGADLTLGDRTDRLLATWVTAFFAALLLAAVVSPTDPATQLVSLPAALLLTLPSAYALVYRGGYRRLRAAL